MRRPTTAGKPLDFYLNDHLAGSTLGTSLAEHLAAGNQGTPLGELMSSLTAEINQDRDTLLAIMDRLGTTKNPIKTGIAWLTEKASQVKFSGFTTGKPELGTFMALETLSLGVEGKLALWRTLQAITDEDPVLASTDFDSLIERAERQRRLLEDERMAAAMSALK